MKMLSALSFVVLLACASSPARADGVKPWLAVDGAWSYCALGQLNDHIDGLNQALTGFASMDNVHGSFGFGGAVGVETAEGVSVGIGYERLAGSTSMTLPEGAGTIEYDLPATVIEGTVSTRINRGPTLLRLGVSGGVIMAAGENRYFLDPLNPVVLKFDGMGPTAEARLSAERALGSAFALTGSIGYRIAKVHSPRIQDVDGNYQNWMDENGGQFSLDYSGPVVRIGLRLAPGR
jgi:hypothetical protein